MLGRVILLLVDAEADGDVFVLRRGGDDDLLRAAFEVLGCCVPVGEKSRAFDHDVAAEIAPGQLGGVAFRQRLESHRRQSSAHRRCFSTVPG